MYKLGELSAVGFSPGVAMFLATWCPYIRRTSFGRGLSG